MPYKHYDIQTGEIKIWYLDDTHQGEFTKENTEGIITASYSPSNQESENESNIIFKENEDFIFEEIFKIINDHKDFYSQFDIRRHFIRTSWSGGRNKFDYPITIRISKSLDIKLK